MTAEEVSLQYFKEKQIMKEGRKPNQRKYGKFWNILHFPFCPFQSLVFLCYRFFFFLSQVDSIEG